MHIKNQNANECVRALLYGIQQLYMDSKTDIPALQSEYEALLFNRYREYDYDLYTYLAELAAAADAELANRQIELENDFYAYCSKLQADMQAVRSEYSSVVLYQQYALSELHYLIRTFEGTEFQFYTIELEDEQRRFDYLQQRNSMLERQNSVLEQRRYALRNSGIYPLQYEFACLQRQLVELTAMRDALVHQCELLGEEAALRGSFAQTAYETRARKMQAMVGIPATRQ